MLEHNIEAKLNELDHLTAETQAPSSDAELPRFETINVASNQVCRDGMLNRRITCAEDAKEAVAHALEAAQLDAAKVLEAQLASVSTHIECSIMILHTLSNHHSLRRKTRS